MEKRSINGFISDCLPEIGNKVEVNYDFNAPVPVNLHNISSQLTTKIAMQSEGEVKDDLVVLLSVVVALEAVLSIHNPNQA